MAKSMNLNAAAGLGGMLKDGHRMYEGVHGAVLRNIDASKAIAAMVRTSLGPNGMNKLVVNHLEKIIVTSDCATILKELEVQHPAARMLVLATQMQEQEFGDYTNFVISFAGELLKLSEDLIRNGLHATEIASGYARALDIVMEQLPNLVVDTVKDARNKEEMIKGIKSVLATKQHGYEDYLSNLIVEACLTTLPPSGNASLNMDSVRIAKLRGGNILQSSVVKGMIVLRDAEGIIKRVENAKVAVYACGFEATSTEAKGTVLLKSADELLNYTKGEERKMEEIVQSIAESGVNVVIANGSISEMAQHFLDKYGLMVIKIQSKYELRRICSSIGATAAVRLGPLTPEELGECSLIEVEEVAMRKITVFKQNLDEDTSIATIVCRAATENVMNDLERALEDGIYSVKTLIADGRLLPGAGALELELAKRIKDIAAKDSTLDQYSLRKFAEALDVVPRTLAENSGSDPTSTMHALHQAHLQENSENIGLDISNCKPFNVVEAGIYDLYASKVNAFRLAVDAAITVLKVDQIVMSKPAGGPKPRAPQAQDHD